VVLRYKQNKTKQKENNTQQQTTSFGFGMQQTRYSTLLSLLFLLLKRKRKEKVKGEQTTCKFHCFCTPQMDEKQISHASFPPYVLHRSRCFHKSASLVGGGAKRPRDDDADDSANILPAPLPFTFDILKRITLRGPSGDRTFYWDDDLVHVMFDAFPKASVHLLILPKDTSIDSLEVLADMVESELTASPSPSSMPNSASLATESRGLRLLRHMLFIGDAIVRHIKATEPTLQHLTFQLGFHSVPSLKHLHMHVMSQDFEKGPALTNKKHYLSFTTAYFLSASTVLREFQRLALQITSEDHHRSGSRVATSSPPPPPPPTTTKTVLVPMRHHIAQWRSAGVIIAKSSDMNCFWCGMPQRTMPALTSHLGTCSKNSCNRST
jgi:diadenosine tetraphosphate (Ap4A) HIT family hydrolase